MTALEVTGLAVSLSGTPILDDIEFHVGAGETVAVLGPSGSGKTTLLGSIAGFVRPDTGRIVVGGTTVFDRRVDLPPDRRSVGFVFQSYALWPHLSALETVAFPIVSAGVKRTEARRRAAVVLAALGIEGLAQRRPADLSGGQQQRVGLARALARDAAVYLLDEPTAHLDAPTRAAAEALIAEQRRERGAAAVYATHDPAEALGIADRVIVVRDGAIVQVGTPHEVYGEPVDAWSARLTGPASVVSAVQRSGAIVVGDVMLAVDGTGEGETQLVIRPEWVRLGGAARGVVTEVRFRGPHTEVTLDTALGAIDVRVAGVPVPALGSAVGWSLARVWRVGPQAVP